MHISHIISMITYFAYFTYFAYAGVNFWFCNFLSKKRHCQIKHQKVKLPSIDNIIHYEVPFHFDNMSAYARKYAGKYVKYAEYSIICKQICRKYAEYAIQRAVEYAKNMQKNIIFSSRRLEK